MSEDKKTDLKIEDSSYGADNIKVLEGLDGIRKRPAMYIGSTGKKGFHHLAFEIIDNSIDEAIAGHCNKITINLDNDGSCRISDDGRGIPVAVHSKKKISSLEVIFSSLHSGGKFDKKSYAISGGLHGVGLAVVNACSEWGSARVWRDGKEYEIKFAQGKITHHLTEKELPEGNPLIGAEIQFYPDREIFTSIPENEFEFDYEYLAGRIRDLAFLNPIEIEIYDNREKIEEVGIDEKEGEEKSEKTPKSDHFKFEGGTSDFVKFLTGTKEPLFPDPIQFQATEDNVVVDLSFQYNSGYQTHIQAYVNSIHTTEGGTHLTGFKSALTRIYSNILKNNPKFAKKYKGVAFSGSDVREGLTAILSVRVPEPQFEGQTKTKLGNPRVRSIVSKIVSGGFEKYIDKHPEIAEILLKKGVSAQKARVASEKARDLTRKKGLMNGLRLPGKLSDCSSKNVEECEIFIVEGDSAGGSAKQARDRKTQAILPLRGKIINVEKARLGKVLQNREVGSIIKALGVDLIESEDGEAELEFDIKNLRYNKVIIMCDADVDGHHIETLLLTLFFRFMQPLVEQGHVYLAVPPIYKLSHRKKSKYLYIEDRSDLLEKEINIFIKEHKIPNKNQIKVQRYKGLGEMNPDELADTTMDPSLRRLHRMVYTDFLSSDHIFSVLMGPEVQPRKDYIMEHYDEALNIDV